VIVSNLVKAWLNNRLQDSQPSVPQPQKQRDLNYMRLNLLLPDVKSNEFEKPKACKRKGCKGRRFYPRQEVEKKIMDGIRCSGCRCAG
jgi:hypothetical protein